MQPENDLELSQAVATHEDRDLWDKRPDESQRAFGAFCLYRDAEKRSFKAIADALSCSTQNVWQWSTRHNWKLRCDAYDLWLDQQQRQEFARYRVRTRTRHLAVAQAMLNVAAHGIKEWQAKIASGAELNLTPEQVALLVKSSAELERNTIDIDGENRPAVINVLFGADGGAWKTAEVLDREQYAQLTEDERRAESQWRNPPKVLEAEDDPQVN